MNVVVISRRPRGKGLRSRAAKRRKAQIGRPTIPTTPTTRHTKES